MTKKLGPAIMDTIESYIEQVLKDHLTTNNNSMITKCV